MLRSKLSPGTRCALEHGGVAPVIVDESANLPMAIDSILKGGFYHAGQVCVSVQRVYAHESVCEELAQQLAAKASKLVVGDQMDQATEVGPLITTGEVERVAQWVDEAVDKGGKLLTGGKALSDLSLIHI